VHVKVNGNKDSRTSSIESSTWATDAATCNAAFVKACRPKRVPTNTASMPIAKTRHGLRLEGVGGVGSEVGVGSIRGMMGSKIGRAKAAP
jgi:hypothetical protein